MPVERLDPSRVAGLCDADVRSFIESDFKIRSGQCPNDCGLLSTEPWGQSCPKCGFSCNTKCELTRQ
jgi:hypothetical protein